MNPPTDLDPIAERLAAWTPASVPSGRDRILFEAGRTAGRRQARWPMAAVVLPLLVGATGWIWHERTERHQVEMALSKQPDVSAVPIRQEPTLASSLDPLTTPGPSSYLVLSRHLDPSKWDRFDPIEPRPEHAASKPRGGPRSVLTPLSSRHPREIADL